MDLQVDKARGDAPCDTAHVGRSRGQICNTPVHNAHSGIAVHLRAIKDPIRSHPCHGFGHGVSFGSFGGREYQSGSCRIGRCL
ncbi:MAG: glycosyl hydrolase family 28 protein [Primorskyibacter sp.]